MVVYNGINLMFPTYGRAATRLPEFIESALEMADDPSRIFFSAMVNVNDPPSREYLEKAIPSAQLWLGEEDLPKPHLAKYWNRIYRETSFGDPGLLVSMVGDDMVFKSKGWDTLLLKWSNALDGVCGLTADACNKITHGVMVNLFTTRKVVDALAPKPFMCEYFPADDMDVVWTETFKAVKRKIFLPTFKLLHNHVFTGAPADETFNRLRALQPEVQEAKPLAAEYIQECVASLREKLKDDFTYENIGVLMTTCERLTILQATVDSYNESVETPKEIHVFDDCSPSEERVRGITGTMPGVVFHSSGGVKRHTDAKTPQALAELFAGGYDAVFIIDSDTIFYGCWWVVLNALYRRMKDSKGFAALTLANFFGAKDPHSMLCVIRSSGAFGLLLTREMWEKFVRPLEKDQFIAWDRHSTMNASAAGKRVYATSPSLLQHIGHSEGTHTGGGVSCVPDFVARVDFFTSFARNEECEGSKDILFACLGRHGDIIHASFYANQLVERGYHITWLTTQSYSGLVGMLCPGMKVLIKPGSPLSFWDYTDTQEMRRMYPGYGFYLNVQPGSPEHEGNLYQSGMSMVDFVRSYIEEVLGIKVDTDLLKYRRARVPVHAGIDKLGKPLCIIAPDAISAKPMWSTMDLIDFYEKYSPEYTVRFLTKELPDDTPLRKKYIGVSPFTAAYGVLQQADLFIGQDSGLTWLSLFCPCQKKIYQWRSWFGILKNRYNLLDPQCEDIIMGAK